MLLTRNANAAAFFSSVPAAINAELPPASFNNNLSNISGFYVRDRNMQLPVAESLTLEFKI